MLRKNGIFYRKVTVEDSEALGEFMLTNLPKTSPICQALGFKKEDYEAMYVPRIAESLPSNLSVLAIDEKSGEIVGYHLVSFFYRDPSKNPPKKLKKTKKAQIIASLSESLREEFWKMCPPEVNCVIRGETSCVRKDYQRKGIAGTFVVFIGLDPRCQDAKQVSGSISVSTSYSNQKLFEKVGFINMAEMSYKELFETHGIPFEGAFKDETTKAILQFLPMDKFLNGRGNAAKL
ncbi:hypothetical protein L596_024233 [Steinernema carpocapsae]|uniref:N-acetyltransferase domain-containing protein n=1 Tax=Steinernema carpocapsae TaxID=34508 RepID=A0A4U5MGE1_STECR|nr:hypothetical protein L596_024233 [Steinernema carpocapsae]